MEKFYRKNSKVKDTVSLQAIEWYDYNQLVEDEDIDENTNPNQHSFYTIKIFGVTENGESITCNVKNFTPFFYIKVPDDWQKNKVKLFIHELFESLNHRYGRPYPDIKKYRCNLVDDKCLIQLKKDFLGFKGDTLFKFLRLTFNNSEAMKRVIYKIKNHNDAKNLTQIGNFKCKFPLYEANLDPVLRFIHIRDINPSGWISISEYNFPLVKTSKTQLEIDVDWQKVNGFENFKNATILQASLDIETYSHDGSFPSADNKQHCIFQIATAFKRYGESDFLIKHALCLKSCKKIDREDVVLEIFENESELLLRWADLIEKMDPDVLLSYNGDQFDFKYFYKRAVLLGIQDEFCEKLSRMINPLHKSQMKKAEFNSSAYGSTEYDRLVIPGRLNFDILIYMRREYKENSYKLNDIAEKFVGENKNPVTPEMMFHAFEVQDADLLRDVMLYCVQDTLLPQKLSDKLHILQNQISMSNITFIPMRYLIEQGQQIKVFSQILKKTRKNNYLVPTIDNWSKEGVEEEKFTGATVLPPITGAYFEPITVCDFASLYPSIIQAHNLCYSTIVLETRYANIPGAEYITHTWEDVEEVEDLEADYSHTDKRRKKAPTKKVSKIQSFTYSKSPGILPEILNELILSRKKYKKLMAEAKTPFEKEVYNKCQLAVKVSMNSVYGFLAAYKIRCKPIAATVTAIGRQMIKDTRDFMERTYPGCQTVYGDTDSVFLKFKTKSTEYYQRERQRIYSQTVITQRDKEHLESLLQKCIKESIELGQVAAENATKALFKKPINLEYEKVYAPILLLSKKRYIGKLFSFNAEKYDKIDKKGVVLQRRDNFQLLKNIYQEIIDIYMEKGKSANDEVINYITNTMLSIQNKRIDLNLLVITKSLRKEYKNENLPHVALAKKITERDVNKKPKSNDRISYLFVDTQSIKALPQYEKVEDPEYVKTHNLPLDVEYYIKFLMNPLCEIMELFIENPEKIFKEKIDAYKKERKLRLMGNSTTTTGRKLKQPKISFKK